MSISKDPIVSTILILLIAVLNLLTIEAACKGSVVFYWRETGEQRQLQRRKWGVLEKEIKGNRAKLSLYFDTKNAYGYTVKGDCCWEVYSENFYKGESAKLIPLVQGFRGLPLKANSLKRIPC